MLLVCHKLLSQEKIELAQLVVPGVAAPHGCKYLPNGTKVLFHGLLLDRDPSGLQKVIAPAVGPPLRCSFIHGCADVGQCVHLGGENTYVREE